MGLLAHFAAGWVTLLQHAVVPNPRLTRAVASRSEQYVGLIRIKLF